MAETFPLPPYLPALDRLRGEVRDFISANVSHMPAADRARTWHGFDPEFSRKLGERGWIGMTWPKEFGGHGRTSLERAGPERFLTSSVLLQEMVRLAGNQPSERAAIAIGRLSAQLAALRRMSFSVAGAMQAGEEVGVGASMVKDLGSVFEQSIPEIARDIFELGDVDDGDFLDVFRYVMLASPSFSIYGGTREILRSIIGRSLTAD
jgi:alkylation response protein AidB-like acyl-CoA dehydrogenase